MPLRLPISTGLGAALRAAMFAVATAAVSTAIGAPPVYLQPPADAGPPSPFEAALSDQLPPARSASGRFLGRPPLTGHSLSRHPAEAQPPGEDAEATLWGHSPISLAQYPLTEPRADRAPDEPELLAPPRTPDLGCDEHPPLLALGETRIDATSVLGSGDALGITSVEFRTAIESPRLPGASLRPIFGMHMLGGPRRTDLPGQVYDISLEARMYLPLGERWLTELALAPGLFSDFRSTDDAFRLVGRAIGYYKCTETLRLSVGGTYLDREDITWLPIGGVIWVPNQDWRYELVFPRPRIAHRYWCEGERERWLYALGELGGGSWAIERAGGAADIGTYRDIRLLLGIEFKQSDGHSWLLEGGFAFARELEYRSGLGDYAPDPAAVVRAALTF
jgi:hypothetical protein